MASNHYIALLRGINVGRAKRVPMGDLCKLVADLGFADVRSVLNSGNVVFSGPRRVPSEVASVIAEALVLRLGVASRVIVLDGDELAGIIDENPLLALASDPSRMMVFVLEHTGLRDSLMPLDERDFGEDRLAVGRRAAYVWCPNGVLESAAAAAVGKQLGDKTTSRNWNTLSKLHALCAERGR